MDSRVCCGKPWTAACAAGNHQQPHVMRENRCQLSAAGTEALRPFQRPRPLSKLCLHQPPCPPARSCVAPCRLALQVAVQVGDHLGDRWVEVLRCASRWELMASMAGVQVGLRREGEKAQRVISMLGGKAGVCSCGVSSWRVCVQGVICREGKGAVGE
eukprot:280113-Chlamydomonas_euryale.AAC.1